MSNLYAGLKRAAEIVQAEIKRAEDLLSVEEGGQPVFDRAQTEAGIAALRTVAEAIHHREIADGAAPAVEAIAAHIDGWRSATFGWQDDPDPSVAARNREDAIQAHAAECLRRIRETHAHGVQVPAPPGHIMSPPSEEEVAAEERAAGLLGTGLSPITDLVECQACGQVHHKDDVYTPPKSKDSPPL